MYLIDRFQEPILILFTSIFGMHAGDGIPISLFLPFSLISILLLVSWLFTLAFSNFLNSRLMGHGAFSSCPGRPSDCLLAPFLVSGSCLYYFYFASELSACQWERGTSVSRGCRVHHMLYHEEKVPLFPKYYSIRLS